MERFGYLVPEFPTQTHIFFWREVEALRRMGQKVVLFSTRKPSLAACPHAFASAAIAETRYLYPPSMSNLALWTAKGVPKIRAGLGYLNGLTTSPTNASIRRWGLILSAADLVETARRERITHIHGHSCADTAHVLALARRMGGPAYSLTLHGDLDVYGGDYRSKMEGASFVCAVGQHLRRQVLDRVGLPANRVFATFMGVETAHLAVLGGDRSYATGKLHMVSVARLHQAKGHIHALRALYHSIGAGLDVHYTIAGEGPHRDVLIANIRELSIEKHVTLTGSLSETAVYQLLSRADLLVLPSTGLGEAWPVCVMEAMGAGLPVVASAIGATPEMITPEKDGFLVSPGDEDALAAHIQRLATDVFLRRRIGDAARTTARQRFDVSVTAGFLRETILASPARTAQQIGATKH